MSNDLIVPVIMGGGAGTRLWPVSRSAMAKQLAPLLPGATLLQQAVGHVTGGTGFAAPVVLGAQSVAHAVREQVAQVCPEASIVVEPARRDTYAAVLMAALIAQQDHGDAMLCVLPSDHKIAEAESFRAAIRAGCAAVQTAGIAVLGMAPTRPATEYGYILPGKDIGNGARDVARFVEKPDPAQAEQMIADGALWNAGVFCFRANWLIDAVQAGDPAALTPLRSALAGARHDGNVLHLGPDFLQAPRAGFDQAFLEKTDQACVLPVAFGWNDLGDWRAVWSVSDKDGDGVATTGTAIAQGCADTLVHATSRMVCAVGLKDVAVVETPDAVLVTSLDHAQDVKGLVTTLEVRGRPEATEHVRSERPWGWSQTMDLGDRFRVKRIVVKPGAQLSLQRHNHRSEHWVIVKGTAEVTNGDDVRVIHENESIYIALGNIHRLANVGKIPLELIEVQTGSYLEEDDIERFEDDFHQVPGAMRAAQ